MGYLATENTETLFDKKVDIYIAATNIAESLLMIRSE